MNLRELLLRDDVVSILWNSTVEEIHDIEPALASLRMNMDNYHHKDNLVHSIKVLQNGIALEKKKDLVLRTALLFHDIGKPATRSKDKGKVTFHNHDDVGARMVQQILPKHGYSHHEIEEIAILVKMHMRAYGFTEKNMNESGIRRIITESGTFQNFERLLTLYRSDLTTKNDNQRNKILKGILILENKARMIKVKDFKKSLRPVMDGDTIMRDYDLDNKNPIFHKIMKYAVSENGLALNEKELRAYIEALL